MIVVRNLYLKYIREYYALYDINLEIGKGEKVVLLGDVDSGKTSLLRILAKQEKMSKGEVYIKDISIKKLNLATDISMGYLPEKPVFLKNKSVYENLKYAVKVRKLPVKEQTSLVNNAMIDFNIEKYKEVNEKDLTLFESYYISLVRLSLRKLDVILVDNIFDKLNEEENKTIIKMINDLFLSKGVTSIIATTKKEIADCFNARIVHFNNGSIL